MHHIFPSADPDLVSRFERYHQDNPNVYAEFAKRARSMRKAGRKKYSQWTIIQTIRWDHDLATVGDVFKINNDYIALYARLMIYDDPSFATFFELRTMKPFNRRSSDEERYR